MPIPSGKQMFVEKIEIDMNTLTELERLHVQKRRSYWKHKETVLAKMKEKYDLKKAERIAAGILPGKRGRKKKYKSDEEILAERSEEKLAV
jgi:gamma-glutamyltranspeptidase